MEVGSNRSRASCSIRRPVHPPPPPPLKQRLGINELEEKSAPQELNPLKNLDSHTASSKQNAPLRRAPPPPLPRASQISLINCVLPSQPLNRPTNGSLPTPPLVRSTLSVSRSISAMQMKTSAPVSVVRPYNFPPLPSPPSFIPEVESLEIFPVKPAPDSSPESGSLFDSFKDPAQDKLCSSSPSFLDELQQVFPLLRQESKALTSHPRCASSKCNRDDQIESNSECETSYEQDCFPTTERIADRSKSTSSPIKVISQPPLPCPPPPVITTLQRRASVPVMSQTNPPRKPTTSEKPVVSHPQLLRNSSFNTSNALIVQKDLKHRKAPIRPVFKSSSLKELRRNEVGGSATLPPPPAPLQRPPLPPRPQKFLMPAVPPPPPRRRESLFLEELKHQGTTISSFEKRFLSRFHPEEDLPPPEPPSPL